jgi:hypothetical protein
MITSTQDHPRGIALVIVQTTETVARWIIYTGITVAVILLPGRSSSRSLAIELELTLKNKAKLKRTLTRYKEKEVFKGSDISLLQVHYSIPS